MRLFPGGVASWDANPFDHEQLQSALSLVSRYGLAFFFVVLALCLTLLLGDVLQGRPPLFLFFAAIAASAWFSGKGPGSFAAVLSAPAGFYFYSFSLHSTSLNLDDAVLFAFFAACATAGGALNSRRREAAEGLERAHRQLEARAAELQQTNNALRAEIAERRRAEQTLQETQTELARVARLTTMGELAASIAHEINQPLAAVVTNAGSCQRWLDQSNLDEARDAVRRIVRDATRASDVVGRIRAMVKKALPERTELDINATIEDVATLLHNELGKHRVVLRTDLAPGLNTIQGDRIQLQQVLLNLMMNAMEAMSAVVTRPRHLLIKSQRQGHDGVAITVQDSGEGFAEGTLERLFDAFVTTKPNGMGLGLSICRTIVEAHGGSLSASQGAPYGAVFQIALPLAAAPQ